MHRCVIFWKKYSLILEKHRRMITQYREVVLRDIKSVDFFETNAPVLYKSALLSQVLKGYYVLSSSFSSFTSISIGSITQLQWKLAARASILLFWAVKSQ